MLYILSEIYCLKFLWTEPVQIFKQRLLDPYYRGKWFQLNELHKNIVSHRGLEFNIGARIGYIMCLPAAAVYGLLMICFVLSHAFLQQQPQLMENVAVAKRSRLEQHRTLSDNSFRVEDLPEVIFFFFPHLSSPPNLVGLGNHDFIFRSKMIIL